MRYYIQRIINFKNIHLVNWENNVNIISQKVKEDIKIIKSIKK